MNAFGAIASVVKNVGNQGSPDLLQATGRLFGLGEAEQTALFRGGIPRWAILGLGIAAGVFVGVYAHRRWPEYAGKIVGG